MEINERLFKITLLLFITNVAVAQFGTTFELSGLNGENGFVISRDNKDSYSFGIGSPIGDINNDGIDDVLFGAPSNDTFGMNRGKIYVLFGTVLETNAVFKISEIDGSNGFVINGINDGDQIYNSQNGGDINNDGIDDMLIGAFGVDTNGSSSGASYVIFGRNNFPATFDLTTLNGNNGFVINGLNFADSLGQDVSFINDINDDDIDDLILGAPTVSGLGNGSCYIIFGNSNPFSSSIDLSLLNGTNGFTVNGINQGDGLCVNMSALGDINGDGISDLNIAAYNQETSSGQYYSINYIIFGSNQSFSSSFDLNLLDGTNGFSIKGIDLDNEKHNQSRIYSAGDFNHDGLDDIILGNGLADTNGTQSGTVYIIFGNQNPWPVNFDLNTLNGNNGFYINGASEFDFLGSGAKTIGDVNSDGIDDIIIPAAVDAELFFTYPVSFVIFGSDNAFSEAFDITTLNGNNGFSINSFSKVSPFNSRVLSPTGAGDFNADGIDDIIIGGSGADLNGIAKVTGFMIYGRGDLIFDNGFED